MKYIRLNILFLSLLSFTFTSCGTMFSVGAGVGGPIASSGSEYMVLVMETVMVV